MEKSGFFLCPFCSAPYTTPISLGISIVKCNSCSLFMLVPPSHGGAVEPCPNHPKDSAVGFCYNCGRSFCRRCLDVVETSDQTSRRVVKRVLCPNCIQKREAEKAREKLAKRIVLSSIVLISIVIGGFIAYSIYTHSEPIGTARSNWEALGSVSAGVHVMITPIDPREMKETNLNRYFADHGTSNDFVSIVVCGVDLAEIEYEETFLQPYMKHIEVRVTFYMCSRITLGANVIPTPHRETMTVFIGKFAPGNYYVTAKIYNGGRIAYLYRDGQYYKVFETGTGGGIFDTLTTYFRIT